MEKSKINFEEISFQMVALAGEAKSKALEALMIAKDGNFKRAEKLLLEAEQVSNEASHAHMDVVVEEANGIKHPFSALFVHAEDQMMNTQTILLLVGEMIELYKKVK